NWAGNPEPRAWSMPRRRAVSARVHTAPTESSLGQVDIVEGAESRQVALELKGEFDGGDLFGIAMGENGDVAIANVGPVAVGLAEVDGLVGFAVGGGPGGAGDVHVYIIRQNNHKQQEQY